MILGPTLYEQDRDAYWQAALSVATNESGSWSSMPQMVKDISHEIAVKLIDPGIFDSYGGSLAEAAGIAYHLALAETWDDTDPMHARQLVDKGMSALHEEHLASHQPAPADPADPSSRVYVSALCLCAQHPAYTALLEYFLSRGAPVRLATVDEDFIGLNVAAARPKRRHRQAFDRANHLAYLQGRCLGMLAVVGEPPQEPAA